MARPTLPTPTSMSRIRPERTSPRNLGRNRSPFHPTIPELRVRFGLVRLRRLHEDVLPLSFLAKQTGKHWTENIQNPIKQIVFLDSTKENDQIISKECVLQYKKSIKFQNR